MAKPTDLKKLDAKLDILIDLIGDIDMEVFEMLRELRKRSGPAGLTPRRGLIIEHITN